MTTQLKRPPTDAQKALLDWIADFIADHGYSPTFRQICKAFGWKSPNSAAGHLNALRARDLVRWEEGASRTLRIVEEK